MGRKHTKEELLHAAVALAFDEGLSSVTFGRVAKRLTIADRTVVYYFPTKDELITEVLMALGGELQTTLGPALAEPVADSTALLRAVWPVLATDDADPVFALFFEAVGLSLAGLEPYRSLVPALVEGWVVWASEFVDSSDEAHRRRTAEAGVAALDGLLLMRQLLGPQAADRAMQELVGD